MHKLIQNIPAMLDPETLFEKAKTSKRHLSLLNFGLARMIPFNKPHKFKITEISDWSIKVAIPYKRINFNHIKGIHACALATASEYATGLVLLNRLNPKSYRIIMQKMEMNYHYQAKMDAVVSFEISEEWLNREVIETLKTNESVVVNCEVVSHDTKGNHLTTGNIYWQIKPWNKVRTKA